MSEPSRRYIPLMFDITDRHILIVGGGTAGLQKVRALCVHKVAITVVSPVFHPEFVNFESDALISLKKLAWTEQELEPRPGLVIAATSDQSLNASIVDICHERGIPVADASNPARGDFISPAAFRDGHWVLSVSSGGTDVKGSVVVRNALADQFHQLVGQRQIQNEFDVPNC